MLSLKNKIEDEINKINNLYEKTIDVIAKSYFKKHEILSKEENDLKEKFQNKITQMKEELESYLSESNEELRKFDRIKKGIKKMEKSQQNMDKILSYISAMNKTKKNMINFNHKSMRNIYFFYEKDKNNIKYKEYYFNGIYAPKNIKFSDISDTSFNVMWDIDKSSNNNLDEYKIKYIVEIKKQNEIFNKVYEGNKNSCSIEKLKGNTEYELRICALYNESSSYYSEIKIIKTLKLDSIILEESKRFDELSKSLYEWIGNKKMDLIFRGSRDGMTGKMFHKKCDNKGPTIILIKNSIGYIFGGYASISWTSDNSYHSDLDSFLFTLTNIYSKGPLKFKCKDNKSVHHLNNYGPIFGQGHDLEIAGDFLNDIHYSNFPKSFKDSLGKGKSIFTGDLNSNKTYFTINEIEVFKVY